MCEEGPALVTYPQGFWYLDVKKRNIHKIFHESVIGNKPVSDLVANKKQLYREE